MDGSESSSTTSTDPVRNVLAHHGIKGMKWGHHKERTPIKQSSASHAFKTASGESMSLEGLKTPVLGRALARAFPSIRDKINNSDFYAIKNGNGDRVGELYTRKDPEEKNAMNVVWVETKKEHKGKGYATATMKKTIDIAKKEGRDKVTLEVPGISPDAKHIYEKLGFKDKGGYKDYDPNDIWGGLTRMELSLPNSAKHSENLIADVLAHHGIKGMKWGHRKSKSSGEEHSTSSDHVSTDHTTAEKHKATIDAHGTKALSNHDLQQLITRMNLEQQHRNLSGQAPTKFKKGHNYVKTVLSVAKTLNDIHNTVNGPVGKAVKTAVKAKAAVSE